MTDHFREIYENKATQYDELVQRDRVHQLIYTDPAIFTAEMTHVFGAVWVYLAHESQIPKNDDFITEHKVDDATTVLVERDCAANPAGPGC